MEIIFRHVGYNIVGVFLENVGNHRDRSINGFPVSPTLRVINISGYCTARWMNRKYFLFIKRKAAAPLQGSGPPRPCLPHLT